ncbi:hypothetical protein MLD38_033868 [Melastoma candidum]|uniref:Uncharacterized protein n=1 Tax=Melastoma candidum TaxID=119954 RepID=A0ACB9MAR3_9MYRT|nr:hypothetical protein MLD38_033868 [Melastoma candidum]
MIAAAVRWGLAGSAAPRPTPLFDLQQFGGIRSRVQEGNLESELSFLQRQMRGSGVERLIKAKQRFHVKNSEWRVLAQACKDAKVLRCAPFRDRQW